MQRLGLDVNKQSSSPAPGTSSYPETGSGEVPRAVHYLGLLRNRFRDARTLKNSCFNDKISQADPNGCSECRLPAINLDLKWTEATNRYGGRSDIMKSAIRTKANHLTNPEVLLRLR